jgi:hypothetical protein
MREYLIDCLERFWEEGGPALCIEFGPFREV